MPLQRGVVRLQVSLPSSQCALLLPKNVILFLELPFYFQELPLHFLELPFLFPGIALLFSRSALLFSRSAFLFLKNALLFSRTAFSFPEVPSIYLLCTSFSKKNAFLQLIFSFCSELVREIMHRTV